MVVSVPSFSAGIWRAVRMEPCVKTGRPAPGTDMPPERRRSGRWFFLRAPVPVLPLPTSPYPPPRTLLPVPVLKGSSLAKQGKCSLLRTTGIEKSRREGGRGSRAASPRDGGCASMRISVHPWPEGRRLPIFGLNPLGLTRRTNRPPVAGWSKDPRWVQIHARRSL
jgi:hypothetical protein